MCVWLYWHHSVLQYSEFEWLTVFRGLLELPSVYLNDRGMLILSNIYPQNWRFVIYKRFEDDYRKIDNLSRWFLLCHVSRIIKLYNIISSIKNVVSWWLSPHSGFFMILGYHEKKSQLCKTLNWTCFVILMLPFLRSCLLFRTKDPVVVECVMGMNSSKFSATPFAFLVS